MNWARKERSLIVEFKRLAPPGPEPFQLCSGVAVLNPERFHASLLADIEDGPRGPRARMGSVRHDLEAYLATRRI